MTKLIQIAAWPVRTVVNGVNKVVPHNTHAGTVVMSVTVIITGSYLAAIPQTVVPHFLWDALAWFVHGMGAAPLIDKLVMKKGDPKR